MISGDKHYKFDLMVKFCFQLGHQIAGKKLSVGVTNVSVKD
jgi:hypothetical protein